MLTPVLRERHEHRKPQSRPHKVIQQRTLKGRSVKALVLKLHSTRDRRGMRLLALFLVLSCPVDAAKPIKVGYVNGLTGPFAGTVVKSLNAVRLSVDKVNGKGGIGGHRIELITFDTKADPLRIPDVMEEVARSGVVAILGFHMSNDALLAADIAEKRQIPMIVAGATHPGITARREYVVRVCWNDDDQGKFSANFAKKTIRAKRIVIVRDVADSYTLYLAESFRRNVKALGLEIVGDYPIRTGDRNFRAVLTGIQSMAAKPDLLYVPTSSVEAGYFIHQLLDDKLSIPLLGCDSWQNADFYKTLSSLGSLSFNAYFVGHWHKELKYPRSREFVKDYEKRFREMLTTLDGDAALAYDSAELLVTALAKEPLARRARLAHLLRVTTIDGATGPIQIGPSGDPIKPVIPLVFSHGKVSSWGK